MPVGAICREIALFSVTFPPSRTTGRVTMLPTAASVVTVRLVDAVNVSVGAVRWLSLVTVRPVGRVSAEILTAAATASAPRKPVILTEKDCCDSTPSGVEPFPINVYACTERFAA